MKSLLGWYAIGFLFCLCIQVFLWEVPRLGIVDKVAIQNDRIAIQDCEREKQEAQKEYVSASRAEHQIVAEFEAAHPGYTLDQEFNVVKAGATPVKNEKK